MISQIKKVLIFLLAVLTIQTKLQLSAVDFSTCLQENCMGIALELAFSSDMTEAYQLESWKYNKCVNGEIDKADVDRVTESISMGDKCSEQIASDPENFATRDECNNECKDLYISAQSPFLSLINCQNQCIVDTRKEEAPVSTPSFGSGLNYFMMYSIAIILLSLF